MKKRIKFLYAIIVISFIASFVASIAVPCFAATDSRNLEQINVRSFYCTVTLYRPYVQIDLHDDDDYNMEYFSVSYSLNNREWVNLSTIDVTNPDLGYVDDHFYRFMWLIPDEIQAMVVAGANVRIRAHIVAADGYANSQPVQIGMVLPDKPIIELYCDGSQLYWTTNFPLEAVSIWTIKIDGINVASTASNRYDISSYFNSYGVLNGNHSFQVSCVLQGFSRVSNVLTLQGVEEFTAPTVDTDLLPGDAPALNSTIALIWSPIKDTKLYQYVFSGLVIVLPLIALLYVIKHVH